MNVHTVLLNLHNGLLNVYIAHSNMHNALLNFYTAISNMHIVFLKFYISLLNLNKTYSKLNIGFLNLYNALLKFYIVLLKIYRALLKSEPGCLHNRVYLLPLNLSFQKTQLAYLFVLRAGSAKHCLYVIFYRLPDIAQAAYGRVQHFVAGNAGVA